MMKVSEAFSPWHLLAFLLTLFLATSRVEGALDCTLPPNYPSGADFVIGFRTQRNVTGLVEDLNAPLFVDYLSNATGYTFGIVALESYDIHRLTSCNLLPFVFINPIGHACLAAEFAAVPLATQVTRVRLPNGSYVGSIYGGGKILVRADSDINTLADLKGKKASTSSLFFLAGAPALYYMRMNGYDPFLTFKALFVNGNTLLVIRDVLTGVADAGLTAHWELDALSEAGLINKTDFRAVGGVVPTPDGVYSVLPPVLHEFVLDAMPSVPQAVQTAVAEALLNIPSNNPALAPVDLMGFVVSQDYFPAVRVVQGLGILNISSSQCIWTTESRLQDHYNLVTCPAGFSRIAENLIDDRCNSLGVTCPARSTITDFTANPIYASYACICDPCVPIPQPHRPRRQTIAIILGCCLGFIALVIVIALILAALRLRGVKKSMPWLLRVQDIQLKEILGQGPTSLTYRGILHVSNPTGKGAPDVESGKDKDSGLHVVVKVIEIKRPSKKKHGPDATQDPKLSEMGTDSSSPPDSRPESTIAKFVKRVSMKSTNRVGASDSPTQQTVSYYYPPGGGAPIPILSHANTDAHLFGESAPVSPAPPLRKRRSVIEVFQPPGTSVNTKSIRVLTMIEEEINARLAAQQHGKKNARVSRSILMWLYDRMSLLSEIRLPEFAEIHGLAILPGEESTKIMLVYEDCPTTLATLLSDSRGHIGVQNALDIVTTLAEGLDHLHTIYLSKGGPSKCHAYGCLSPDNVLLTDTLQVKLAPFGLTAGPLPFIANVPTKKGHANTHSSDGGLKYDRGPSTPGPTRHSTDGNGGPEVNLKPLERIIYKAPELLLGGEPTAASDVYALAILAYSTLTWRSGLPGDSLTLTPGELQRRIVEEQYRPPADPAVPKPLYSLLEECWSSNPLRRPSFAEVVSRLRKISVSPLILKAVAIERRSTDRRAAQAAAAPKHLRQRLTRNSKIDNETYPQVTIVAFIVDKFHELDNSIGLSEKMELITRLDEYLENLAETFGVFKIESMETGIFAYCANIHEPKIDHTVRALAFANGARLAAMALPLSMSKPSAGNVSLSGAVASGAAVSQVIRSQFLVTGEAFGTAIGLIKRIQSNPNHKPGIIIVSPAAAAMFNAQQLLGHISVHVKSHAGRSPVASQTGQNGMSKTTTGTFYGQSLRLTDFTDHYALE